MAVLVMVSMCAFARLSGLGFFFRTDNVQTVEEYARTWNARGQSVFRGNFSREFVRDFSIPDHDDDRIDFGLPSQQLQQTIIERIVNNHITVVYISGNKLYNNYAIYLPSFGTLRSLPICCFIRYVVWR